MDILEVKPRDENEWDNFVRNSRCGTFYQLIRWREVMKSVFGHSTYYFFAKEGERILGVLPLIHINSLFFGHYLTSMPGGLCAEDQQTADALVQRAIQLVKEINADYLILRDCRQEWKIPELITDIDHCTMVVKLDPDPRKTWLGINREERRLIRKSYSQGVKVTTSLENINDFYPVYLEAMRDKGTPPFGFEFFNQMRVKFPAELELQTVQRNGEILAGGFIAPIQDTVYCTWAGIPPNQYQYRPSHLLLWKAMEYGCNHGFEYADLGRSKRDSGSFKFKLNLGAVPHQLYQYYYLNGISHPPAVGASREEETSYRSFVKLWRHIPLNLTQFLGSRLRKGVPFG